MAVLIRHRSEGMDLAQYDEVSPPLVEKIKTQPGFIVHVSYVADSGEVVVAEVWETQEQHDQWLSKYVTPNVPNISQEVIQLHSVHTA